MNRIAARLLAGAATMAVASTVVVSAASAATSTITLKVVDKPIVSAVSGDVVKEGTISATTSVAGTVAFTTAPDTATAGTPIKGCESVATTTTAPFVAMCSGWRPSAPTTSIYVLGTLTPTDATVDKSTGNVKTLVSKPINESSVIEGISVYVDTVNGSSTPVAITNGKDASPYLPSGGCLLMSQFQQGQQIVWRVYANDFNNGGTPLTGQTATMNIKIAGWDTAVVMTYGDHSGTSFWAGSLNTGIAGSGKFSALGKIDYTINISLIDKPAVTKDVTVTKYVKVLNAKTKKPVKVNGAYVWKPTQVTQTQVVTPAIVSHTLAFTPAAWAAASSTLTLLARA